MLLYVIQFFSSKFFKFSKKISKIFLKTKKTQKYQGSHQGFLRFFSILGVTPFSFSIAHALYYVNMLRRVFRNN